MKLKKCFLTLFCVTGLLGSAIAQTSSEVYEYSYVEDGNYKSCMMKTLEFTSYTFENAIMFHVDKEIDGSGYLFTFNLMGSEESSPIIDWALASDTNLKEIKIMLKLSNGKILSTKAFIQDNTRTDLRGSKDMGSVLLAFGCTYDSFAQQLTQYDIESIAYMGKTLSFGNVKTAYTISSMINDIRSR